MNYVIAASRPWYSSLAERLSKSLGHTFTLIADPQELTLEHLRAVQPRYVFFPHWSTIIPEDVFSEFECVVFHMTDLPFGRGGSPLQNLIVRGIYETRISALRCTAELDAGPIYLKRLLSLNGTAEEIFTRAAGVIGEMIADIVQKEPVPEAQSGTPTVFKRRKPAESDIAPIADLQKLFDHIRMLDAEGYPHAFLETEHLRLEFRRAALESDRVTAEVTIRKKTP